MSKMKPIPEGTISKILQQEYNLTLDTLKPVNYGADEHARSYHAVTRDGSPYFIKLRSGPFHTAALSLPRYLYDQGIDQVIPPIPSNSGNLFVDGNGFKLIIYPLIDGCSAAEIDLTPAQWRTFGHALAAIHRLSLPYTLRKNLPLEDYAPTWRRGTIENLAWAERTYLNDPISQELADFLMVERGAVLDLVDRAEILSRILIDAVLPPVLCHGDIHEANLLIAEDGRIYLIDWDDPILAPRERDLMFIGGGVIGRWKKPKQADWFYQGYGRVKINPSGLAYYRCERIITDIAIYCNNVFKEEGSLEERRTSLHYLKSNFEPGGTIEIAMRT